MLDLLQKMEKIDAEQVVFCFDDSTGLKGIVVIHDTTLGPAIGGLRIYNYESVDQALNDALKLSYTMTLKSAISGLNLGGGSAVIILDTLENKKENLLRAFGRHVECLGGRFYVGEDLGSTVDDMEIISNETKYVVGLNRKRGGSGDPAHKAAYSVFRAIQACLEEKFGDTTINKKTIAIQGLGAVGKELARLLFEEGANLIVTDINFAKIDKLLSTNIKAEVVKPDEIYEVDCDIFAPCALGEIINDNTIEKLKAKIIAGSANNQLSDETIAEKLQKKGILYAPDFVINAGGLINAAEELYGYNEFTAQKKINNIYNTLKEVFNLSKIKKISTNQAAIELAYRRINEIRKIRKTFLPPPL